MFRDLKNKKLKGCMENSNKNKNLFFKKNKKQNCIMWLEQKKEKASQNVIIFISVHPCLCVLLLCRRDFQAENWWLCLHLHCSHGGLLRIHLGSFQLPQSTECKGIRIKMLCFIMNYNNVICVKELYESRLHYSLFPTSAWTYLFDLVFKVSIIIIIDHLR